MRFPLPPRATALASTLAILLAACGGGSGTETASTPVPRAALAVQVQPDTALEPQAAPTDDDSGKRTQAATARRTNSIYVVQMDAAPVTGYTGGVSGLAATKPRKGQKIDPNSPAVTTYMAYLAGRHDAALRSVGNARKIYSYGYVFDGFAAELSDAQAQQLAQAKGVLTVTKDELRALDTSTTPGFLGLSGDTGFWARTGAKGEGVVVGVVDSGIWPESGSFSDRTGTNGSGTQDGKLGYVQLPGWHGRCIPGDQFTASHCNQKLIGARWYNAGWGGDAGIRSTFPEEFVSPRDWGGHGTHTASTAAGNSGVPITGVASAFGSTSGMAPRARVAVYKVCWSVEPEGGCFNSDSVAAIDQAVADGVDVINFSISGTRTNFRDPVEIAFLNAADAGVFVAASAGNSGPTSSTVAHPSPWLTTVAAGTHNRKTVADAVLGNGVTYTGASFATSSAGPAPLVNASAVGNPGATATAASLCFSSAWPGGPGLDPALVRGKIVVCERGTNDRVDKSRAVAEAGGVGMILVNASAAADTLAADIHSVPTVHLPLANRAAVQAYAASSGATATVTAYRVDLSTPAPATASFSSRGPLLASGSLLKPDIMAPGVDVLASVAPPGNGGRSFDFYSGTSMSSPHIAGIAALFKEMYPSWSPMMIKSALMTTSRDTIDSGISDATRNFRQGAGFVQPNAATDPGLVFDSGYADWLGFLCGTQLPTSFCTNAGVPVIHPSNFNSPSIAFGSLAGSQVVTRRVTNVGKSTSTYSASMSGLSGFSVAIAPSSFSIAPGETRTVTVTFTRTGAALNTYAGGQLTFSDGSHNVRIPVVARPVPLGVPAETTGSYKVSFGYDGPFTATPIGLVPATRTTGSVTTGSVVNIPVEVPAGTLLARFSLFDTDVSAPSDLDMEVYFNGALVGSSGGPTAAEQVQLSNPAPGTYTVRVVGYATPAGGTTFSQYSWSLTGVNNNNLAVTAPSTAVTGQSGTVTLTPSGLSAGKYLGAILHGGAPTPLPSTIVRIDN